MFCSEMDAVRSVIIVSFACTAIFTHALEPSGQSVSVDSHQSESASSDVAEEPLLLTPFIDAGNATEARNLARDAPLLDNIETYSGYFTVNSTSKSHLFFWYIPKTSAVDNTTAPLVLWLNGGPGTSSLFGLLLENGPFQVTSKDGVRRRTHAWTDNYNMLYIDQPVGTGFSFTEADGYISTEEEVAEHLYEALRQFYLVFTEFEQRDLYIAGESYAGMYIPALGHKIHSMNQQRSAGFRAPLKGLMIGNGFSDAETQYEYGALLHGLGMIDRRERAELEAIQNRIKYRVRSRNWSRIYDDEAILFAKIRNMLGPVSLFDYTQDEGTYREFRSAYINFLKQSGIGQIVHVGRREFDITSDKVWRDFRQDEGKTVRPWVEELLEHYPVLFYSGQFDIMVAHTFTENFLSSLHWSGALEYEQAKKRVWRVGKSVAGYYKIAGNLVNVVVRNAGHQVPTDQPGNSLIMIDLFVRKQFKTLSATN